MLEKKALSPEVLEAQTVMELPDREMFQANVNFNAPGVIQVGVAVGSIDVNIEDNCIVVLGSDVQC